MNYFHHRLLGCHGGYVCVCVWLFTCTPSCKFSLGSQVPFPLTKKPQVDSTLNYPWLYVKCVKVCVCVQGSLMWTDVSSTVYSPLAPIVPEVVSQSAQSKNPVQDKAIAEDEFTMPWCSSNVILYHFRFDCVSLHYDFPISPVVSFITHYNSHPSWATLE